MITFPLLVTRQDSRSIDRSTRCSSLRNQKLLVIVPLVLVLVSRIRITCRVDCCSCICNATNYLYFSLVLTLVFASVDALLIKNVVVDVSWCTLKNCHKNSNYGAAFCQQEVNIEYLVHPTIRTWWLDVPNIGKKYRQISPCQKGSERQWNSLREPDFSVVSRISTRNRSCTSYGTVPTN